MNRNTHPFIHHYKALVLCSGRVLLYDTFIVMKCDEILYEVDDLFLVVKQILGLCV